MLFPTLGFALFFLVVYLMAWALNGSNEWRKIALLLASWFFYGAWDPRFVALLFASGVGNWAIGQGIVRARSPGTAKVLLTIGIVGNLGILGWFKYAGFFFEQLSGLVHALEALARGASVAGVSDALGYATPSNFIAMFRRAFGESPARYFAKRATPHPDR